MGFFDVDIATSDHDSDHVEWVIDSRWGWVGGVVPRQVILGRSDAAAVTVSDISVDPDGFDFRINAFVRRPPKRNRARRLPSAYDFQPYLDDRLTDNVLRYGIEWPDGVRATNLDENRLPPDATRPTHLLTDSGSGGNEGSYMWECRARPSPSSTAGTVTFVCEWPGLGIHETRFAVPAAEFVAAAEQAEPIWPDIPRPRDDSWRY
jgi:hypothetical protein